MSAFSFISDFRHIERPVKNVIASEFFIQMVNATFMNILPLYLDRLNYSDEKIALFTTLRFIGVFALAFPLGRYIRKKRLMPMFFVSNLCVPLFALMITFSIWLHLDWLTIIMLLLWGASFTFIQIPVLPYILRNSAKHNHTAAISLSYSTWSFAGIISGLVIASLDFVSDTIFDEQMILILFSLTGFGGLYYLWRIRKYEETAEEVQKEKPATKISRADWKVLSKALIPTLIIATGAGLTIPFISWFFSDVHHVGKGGFSVLSFIASILVAYCAMIVPRVKETIGYKVAIPMTQSLAVISLVALATTQFYSNYPIAVVIAAACYLLRQPLMNMAGPMTSEIVIKYVGKRNREITSALISAIWSGSWVVSGFMVTVMKAANYTFGSIFLITSLLYAIGVVMYYLLILDYHRKEAEGLIE